MLTDRYFFGASCCYFHFLAKRSMIAQVLTISPRESCYGLEPKGGKCCQNDSWRVKSCAVYNSDGCCCKSLENWWYSGGRQDCLKCESFQTGRSVYWKILVSPDGVYCFAGKLESVVKHRSAAGLLGCSCRN